MSVSTERYARRRASRGEAADASRGRPRELDEALGDQSRPRSARDEPEFGEPGDKLVGDEPRGSVETRVGEKRKADGGGELLEGLKAEGKTTLWLDGAELKKWFGGAV